MKGYNIEYQPHDSKSRTLLNHTLFGRLVYHTYQGRKTAYYIQGMLHKTKFRRLVESKIFVQSLRDIDVELLETFGNINIEETDRDVSEDIMTTGEQHWRNIATERNATVRTRRYKNGTRI